MKTPYFLINQELLDENIFAFQDALKRIWPNSQLAYSVKTNSLPWLLTYLKKNNIFAEVVSDEEYELALKCGYKENEVIFNGPIKGENTFLRACKNGSIVNLDSKQDLRYLEKYGAEASLVGVRINVPPELFNTTDIDYTEDGFRFGFADETGELEMAMNNVRQFVPQAKIGFHMHCNSITRSADVYKSLAKYAVALKEKYQVNLDFIDIGGGFFGGLPDKTSAEEYLMEIKEALFPVITPETTKLYLEPGSAIIGSVVELHTSVLDIKDTSHSRIVTTDGSRIHIDPLWMKSRYMYSVDTQSENVHEKQIICGYTCMDHDRIMSLQREKELQIGDKIIYNRVGAYSMTFGGLFIRYFPEVYVKNGNNTEKIRSYTTVDEYFSLNS